MSTESRQSQLTVVNNSHVFPQLERISAHLTRTVGPLKYSSNLTEGTTKPQLREFSARPESFRESESYAQRVAALLLASGQAAETIAILNIAGVGDHVVSSPRLYGGTYNLFRYTLAKLGIEVSFVEDPDDLDQWRAAVRPNTKAFYGETVSNPHSHILDIPGVGEAAHSAGLPLIVDNTIATPYLIQPIAHGADIAAKRMIRCIFSTCCPSPPKTPIRTRSGRHALNMKDRD